MPRRKRPSAEQLVSDYKQEPDLGIAGLRERYGLSYQAVYVPLKDARVLRGTSHLKRPSSPPE